MTQVYSQLAGRDVDTWSEEWRHECECRWLLTEKPTRTQKHLHLYGVADRQSLMTYDTKTGRPVLRDNHAALWTIRFPLMKARSLEAADRLLADAKRLYEMATEK